MPLLLRQVLTVSENDDPKIETTDSNDIQDALEILKNGRESGSAASIE